MKTKKRPKTQKAITKKRDFFSIADKIWKVVVKIPIFLAKSPKKLKKIVLFLEKKMGRGLLYVGGLLILVLASLFLVERDFDARVVSFSSSDAKEEQDDIRITQFHTSYFTDTKSNWNIKAKVAKVFEKKDKMELYSVFLKHFDKKNDGTTIKADRSIVENKTKNVYLYGNVVMKNKKGTTILGESFFYNNKTEMVTSEEIVTIIDPEGSKILGKGFSTNRDLEKITFTSSVQGEIISKE